MIVIIWVQEWLGHVQGGSTLVTLQLHCDHLLRVSFLWLRPLWSLVCRQGQALQLHCDHLLRVSSL